MLLLRRRGLQPRVAIVRALGTLLSFSEKPRYAGQLKPIVWHIYGLLLITRVQLLFDLSVQEAQHGRDTLLIIIGLVPERFVDLVARVKGIKTVKELRLLQLQLAYFLSDPCRVQ